MWAIPIGVVESFQRVRQKTLSVIQFPGWKLPNRYQLETSLAACQNTLFSHAASLESGSETRHKHPQTGLSPRTSDPAPRCYTPSQEQKRSNTNNVFIFFLLLPSSFFLLLPHPIHTLSSFSFINICKRIINPMNASISLFNCMCVSRVLSGISGCESTRCRWARMGRGVCRDQTEMLGPIGAAHLMGSH